ncbi:serine protein kinase RIO [Candidatus Woesearchaeota archaeon]|nr:serine protein kinase RIO [Candidatus Woesearchaeota archaeon]
MPRISKEEWKVYKNVFDKFTIHTLFKLISQGHFDGLHGPHKIGKESNIYLAEKDKRFVIVKIYRLETCNFNKMYSYIRSDPRYIGLQKKRRKIIFAWVQREYRNLLKAREVINVPTPYVFLNNVLVMEMIGDSGPALMIKDHVPSNTKLFFNLTIDSIRRLYKAGLIHADLSEFNILNYHEKPYFIDFSQGTSVNDSWAEELLKRDIGNVCRFFAKWGIKKDPDKLIKDVVV